MKQQTYRLFALLLALLLPLTLMEGSASAEDATVAATTAQVSTAFTYQGQLKRDGGAFSGDCAFRFGLWNAETGGSEFAFQPLNNVAVKNGLFTVQLDFGNQFTGDARWLELKVQCASEVDPTTLEPRILLTSSPYAIGLMPGSQINGSIPGAMGVVRAVNHAAGAAIVGMAVPSTGQTFGVLGNAFSPGGTAISGYTENGGTAVRGLANDSGVGVWGSSGSGAGVYGESTVAEGVSGLAHHKDHAAVLGVNDAGGQGVYGKSDNGAGVVGVSKIWVGVYGESDSAFGIQGQSTTGAGVVGDSGSWIGVYGESDQNEGMRGLSRSPGHGGVVGVNESSGPGVYGRSIGGGFAMVADGKLSITGGGDVAERFASVDGQPIAPGNVVVVDEANPGQLKLSTTAYDLKVIGVVSGAGGVEPGLILHQEGMLEGELVVAIAGRVYCQAEADSAPIAPGDLLTTADRPGHCMKASDRERAYGATIGKALTGLEAGVGQVLVLVNLH